MTELIARAFIESGNTGKTDQFWLDVETAYLAAIFAHVATLDAPTPLTAYRFFTRQSEAEVLHALKNSPSDIAREQAVVYDQTDAKIKGGILPAVAARLRFLRDPAIARFTSASLNPPDFSALRYNPSAIYYCLREQDIARLRPLTSAFFTILIEQLASVDEDDEKAIVPVIGMLDEFANIGKIPDFDTTISVARGRNLALWLGIQSLSQLNSQYGDNNARTIVANLTTMISLHALDPDTSEFVSRSLGDKTESYTNLNFTFGAGISISSSAAAHERRLMTADEVRRIEKNQAICRTSNKKPMQLNKGYWNGKPRKAVQTSLGEPIFTAFTEKPGNNGNGANGAKKLMYELE